MWCKHCRQDVPALRSDDDQGRPSCPRCGETLEMVVSQQEALPAYDSWELDEQLRHIGRELQVDELNAAQKEAVYQREALRYDLAHAGLSSWHALPAAAASEPPRDAGQKSRGEPLSGALAWSALSLGTMSLVCGCILLGWSLAAARPELWNIGLPAALVGQIALLIGLVMQLDRLWRDHRQSAAKLDNVDDQLHELKTAATLLGTSHGVGAGAFYSHFAGGAGPHVLLTDLKSQLDLLALKISQQQ